MHLQRTRWDNPDTDDLGVVSWGLDWHSPENTLRLLEAELDVVKPEILDVGPEGVFQLYDAASNAYLGTTVPAGRSKSPTLG